jgi:hypothetical protein
MNLTLFIKSLLINFNFGDLNQEEPLLPFGEYSILFNRLGQILTFVSGFIILIEIYKSEIIRLKEKTLLKYKELDYRNTFQKIRKLITNIRKINKLKSNHPSKIPQMGLFYLFNNSDTIKDWESNNPTETKQWKQEILEVQMNIGRKYLFDLLIISMMCIILYVISQTYGIDYILLLFAFLTIYLFLDYVFIYLTLQFILIISIPITTLAYFMLKHPQLSRYVKLCFFGFGMFGFIISFLNSKG